MLKKPGEMNTLVSVLERLKEKGWENEFRMTSEGFKNSANEKYYKPEELEIIKTYRFEGESDPSDSSILYVIKETASDFTGYCTDIYGAYSDDTKLEEFIKAIPVVREEQLFDDQDEE